MIMKNKYHYTKKKKRTIMSEIDINFYGVPENVVEAIKNNGKFKEHYEKHKDWKITYEDFEIYYVATTFFNERNTEMIIAHSWNNGARYTIGDEPVYRGYVVRPKKRNEELNC